MSVLATLPACLPSVPAGLTSPDPTRRVNAIVEIAAEDDTSEVPGLIVRLESLDALERLVAIRALEDLTGLTHGYNPYSSESERDAAIERWTDWLASQPAPAS